MPEEIKEMLKEESLLDLAEKDEMRREPVEEIATVSKQARWHWEHKPYQIR